VIPELHSLSLFLGRAAKSTSLASPTGADPNWNKNISGQGYGQDTQNSRKNTEFCAILPPVDPWLSSGLNCMNTGMKCNKWMNQIIFITLINDGK
jgi:hypothetical protein